MHISFNGRRVVIAGGSRGIGRSIALGFAAAGADVSICARGPDKLRQTAEELRKLGARVHESVCDLSDGPAVLDLLHPEADCRRWLEHRRAAATRALLLRYERGHAQ